MPAPVETGRFNHAALNTSDVARSVAFYTKVLGFYEVPRPNFSFAGSWLYSDGLGMMLHLIHDGRFVPQMSPLGTRTNHLAFRVADYEKAVEQLAQHGIEVVRRVLPDHGYRQAFFYDPDFNLIELGEWPDVEKMVI